MKSHTVLAISLAVTCLFFLDLCGSVFSCGCRSLWAGMADHCNIHRPGERHCPWCANLSLAGASFAAIVGVQCWLSFRPNKWTWRSRLAASVAAFPVVGLSLALFAGHIYKYWNL